MPTIRAWRCQGRPARARALVGGRWASLAACGLVLTMAEVRAQPVAPARSGTGEERSTRSAEEPRASVALDATVTFGPRDPAYFNHTDYDENALRLALGALGASYRVADWLDAVGEVQAANVSRARVSALYVRIRPWRDRPVHVSAGRIPPVFGAFARTRYAGENPLISAPLAYQYLSTLRPDLVPESADALLAVRGRGWRVDYPTRDAPYGAEAPPARSGVALVTTSRWDTGVVVHAGMGRLAVTGGVTMGSLSDPRVDDNNRGKQVVTRVEWRPDAAWTFGLSAARGAFASQAATRAAAPDAAGSWPQQAVGFDADFAVGHLRVRGEIIASSWRVATPLAPAIEEPLRALAATLEARMRVHPRFDLAGRVDWLGFSEIRGTLYDGAPTTWDANVTRVEVGTSYRLSRRSRLKLAYQHDWRRAGPRRSDGFPAVQLAFWF